MPDSNIQAPLFLQQLDWLPQGTWLKLQRQLKKLEKKSDGSDQSCGRGKIIAPELKLLLQQSKVTMGKTVDAI